MFRWNKINFHMIIHQVLDSYPTLFDAEFFSDGFGDHYLPLGTDNVAHTIHFPKSMSKCVQV